MPWCDYGRKAILGRQIDSMISICSKVSAGIGAVRRVNAIIQPYFDYCSPLWGRESNHWILQYWIV